jgi:glycogen phosphorylase
MIERINFRTGISASLFRSAQAALIGIPRKLHSASHKFGTTASFPRSTTLAPPRSRDRWLAQAQKLTILQPITDANPFTRHSDLEFNPCQWLLHGNPLLASLVTETIGNRWINHQNQLQQLAAFADDPLLQSRWQAVKEINKLTLASYLYRAQGIRVNVSSLFDLQLQPIVEHQRQILNILHIIALFNQIKQEPEIDLVPRTFIFGTLGEIEPWEVEEAQTSSAVNNLSIIALIQSLAKVIAGDPDVSGKLQVVYIPNSAGLMSQMYAAADLTQEIAPATIEDVDLDRLQAAVNGVLSIGSLGKSNYYLQQLVGEQNYFSFGLPIPEIALFKEYGYDPYNYYKHYPAIRQAIDSLSAGNFTPEQPSSCSAIVDNLVGTDNYMVLADYVFYAACQARVSDTYRQQSLWTQMSILNVAGIG